MADLFGVQRPAITKHLKNIFESGELDEQVVGSILEHTTQHGAIEGKTQTKAVKYYNLDAIIAVDYRVNSKRAEKAFDASWNEPKTNCVSSGSSWETVILVELQPIVAARLIAPPQEQQIPQQQNHPRRNHYYKLSNKNFFAGCKSSIYSNKYYEKGERLMRGSCDPV